MRKRFYLVSNSSSSSFILDKKYLSEAQQNLIVDHKKYAPVIKHLLESNTLFKVVCGDPRLDEWELDTEHNAWCVKENDTHILLETYLDNFNMEEYLKIIRAEDSIIHELEDLEYAKKKFENMS